MNMGNYIFILSGIFLIIFCYFYIDIPLAWYSYQHHLRSLKIFHALVFIHQICMWASAIGILSYAYLSKKYRKFSFVIITTSLSVAAAQLVNEVLKIIFGRYWISTYLNHNKSLIHDGIYGFNFFRGTLENSSFPSGNIALISAAMLCLCKFFPHRKLWFLLVIFIDAVTIYGLNYHFISDMVGGLIVGFCIANIIYSLMVSSYGKK